ncbi:MAG: hypothetical protein GY822_30660 [Deltaproteobacteria bacterium]|nr:hypothetical protein [Deltaproteobacteria bacterium]
MPHGRQQGVMLSFLRVDLVDEQGEKVVGTQNFLARGGGARVPLRFVVGNPQVARSHAYLVAKISIDLETGVFSEWFSDVEFQDDGSTVFALVEVLVDPNRTLSTLDDKDVFADRRAFAVQVVDDLGRPASALTLFELPSTDAPRDVVITIHAPPEDALSPESEPEQEPMPLPIDVEGDGLRTFRVVVNDGAAHALSAPELKLSFDGDGVFDASFSQKLSMTRMEAPFDDYWELVVKVQVDSNRILDGETLETFPYFAYLVAAGTDYEALSVSMVAPDETPAVIELFLGNPEWTPVSFRVDVGGAFLNSDGTQKGLFDGEAVFLTGEWQSAVDALGTNCGDAFSGGEQSNLKMRPLVGHDGVWERTIWLPPGRPYGWKVVRCDAALGCGVLNQFVNSAGRAFATVMKNLATDNVDAFADPLVGIVDPIRLQEVEAAGEVFDYSNAEVHIGSVSGGEQDPEGTPDGERLFKQEAPDLVVVVGATPLKTRVYSVGTWRDVNLGQTPQEVIDAGELIELTLFDYDDGFIGRYPPSRENP